MVSILKNGNFSGKASLHISQKKTQTHKTFEHIFSHNCRVWYSSCICPSVPVSLLMFLFPPDQCMSVFLSTLSKPSLSVLCVSMCMFDSHGLTVRQNFPLDQTGKQEAGTHMQTKHTLLPNTQQISQKSGQLYSTSSLHIIQIDCKCCVHLLHSCNVTAERWVSIWLKNTVMIHVWLFWLSLSHKLQLFIK